MIRTSFLVSAIALLATVVGCKEVAPRVGQKTSIDFGLVRSADEVQLNSTAAEGALIGGTLGLMLGGRRGDSRVGAAIGGATLGGVAGGVAGGDRTGMSYTVQMQGGSSTRIVTDQREIHVGDCVAVERVGQSANIRRVSAGYCQPAYAQAVEAVDDSVRDDAVQCERAKQELMDATAAEAVQLAARKVELLCNA
jgi:outer membrane lipoprotein SlyB